MSPDHEAWFAKADEDFLVIDNNLAAEHIPWAQLCFHAQQPAEKYLKGLLVFHGVPAPKTHDLVRLIHLITRHDKSISRFIDEARRLTELGFRSRYPDWPGHSAKSEARGAITSARSIQQAVRDAVGGGRS